MSINNFVTKVLVTTGNQDILAAGNTLDSLALGQIGIFDEATNLSIDETSAKVRNLFFAVAVDKDGDGVKDDIEVSAGQYIQTQNTKNLSYRPHTAAQDQIVDVVNFVDGECDYDYNLKIELRNSEIYKIQGFNQFTKTFSIRTACCIGTQTSVDGNDIALLFRDAINSDQTGMFAATLVARQALTIATHGTAANYSAGAVVTDADILDLIVYNAANPTTPVYVDIRITLGSMALYRYCNVNLKYNYPRNTTAIVSPLQDFTCIGAAVEIYQAVAFEEGSGYDIKQKEYNSHDNSGPYVSSTLLGVAFERNYYADKDEEYDQFVIDSDFKAESGWKQYSHQTSTIIAIPETSSVTSDALVLAIDVLFGGLGFTQLASDVATANVNPAVLEPTSGKGAANDGLA